MLLILKVQSFWFFLYYIYLTKSKQNDSMGNYSPVWSDKMLDSLNKAKHNYHRIFLYLMGTPSCHIIALYYCSDTKGNIQILYAGVHQCDK
jgi:hypothetical protein